MQEKEKDLIIINIASFIMSFSALFAKWISLESYIIVYGRSLVAFPILLFACFAVNAIKPLKSKKHFFLVLLSGLLMTSHWIFFYMSVQKSTVAIAVISFFSYPLITSFLEPFFLKIPLKRRSVTLSGVLVIGIAILSGHSLSEGSVLLGILWGVVAAFSFATRNIIVKDIVHNYSPIWLMLIQTSISMLILAPFGTLDLIQADPQDLILIVIVGSIIIALGHSLFVKCMKTLSATSVGIIASLQLIYSVISGWLLLGEVITNHIIIGGLIIMAVSIVEQIDNIPKS